MIKNLPCKAGDSGWITSLERSRILGATKQCGTATEPVR